MVSEPPFSPGLAPVAGDPSFSPISGQNPNSGAFRKCESWLQPPKAAHPCVHPEHQPQEAETLDREKTAGVTAKDPFLAARDFVWRNLCRSFYVERSTADFVQKTAQNARVDQSTQNDWKIPAVDQSTQITRTISAVDQSTQKSAGYSVVQDDDPQTPNRIGGSIQLPPLQVTNVAFSKSATALPTAPLGQTAPGPIYSGLPRAGISPVAPGHATMTGIQ